MAVELTAIQVRIGLRPEGGALYPDFNQLPVVQASRRDWTVYVDQEGLGWHYDHTSGHGQDDPPRSPRGIQLGMLVIPEQFAIEAIAQFPTQCSRLTEAQATTFHDDKSQIRMADEDLNAEILNSLRQERELLRDLAAAGDDVTTQVTELQAKTRRALNPDDIEPGKIRNRNRRWATRKTFLNFTYKEPP